MAVQPPLPPPSPFLRADLVDRVVMLTRFGGPEGLVLTERPMPIPGPGEILVRVLAASVQSSDTLLRAGKYPEHHAKPPLVLGYDVVGEIVAFGPRDGEPSPLHLGDRVADLTVTGSHARYRSLSAKSVVRVPDGLDAGEVVSLVLSYVAAWQLLHREARVRTGQRVLVHGAAGSVGLALLALGKLAGLEMWGTARADHAAVVRAAGATPVDYRVDCRTLRADGFDVVFDGIGEDGFERSWECVAKGGTLVAYGCTSGAAKGTPMAVLGWWVLRLQLWHAFGRDRSARFYSINAMRKSHPDWYRADLARLLSMLAAGTIHPRIADRIGFDGVANAHRRLEAGGLEGKIILYPWGEDRVARDLRNTLTTDTNTPYIDTRSTPTGGPRRPA